MSELKFTPEQQKIITAQGNIRVNAIAGSGKTTTILEYAANQPKTSKILYLAFNKSVKIEAQLKVADKKLENVQVETAHALAFHYIVKDSKYKVQSRNYKAYEIAKILNIKNQGQDYTSYIIADHVLKFTSYFCNGTANKIHDTDYLQTVTDPKAKTFVRNYYKQIEGLTRRFLAKMENAEIPITHDFYLKKFQLSNPVLPYDYILFDEGQDASQAMLEIFLKQKAIKVIVGDTHQQIYSWRYAVNSLEKVDFPILQLSCSFRFNEHIANLAEYILSWKKYIGIQKSFSVKGLAKPTEQTSKAILARTNLGLLLKAIEYVVDNNKADKIYFEGNINSYTYADDGTSLYDVLNLHLNKKHLIKDDLIKFMENLEQLEDYIKKTEDVQLSMMVEIVKEYGSKIPDILNVIKAKHITSNNKEEAEVIFSTVHRSKGMEYDAVLLVNDFMDKENITKLNEQFGEQVTTKINEEINLLYVAVTRAKKLLFIPENLLPLTFEKNNTIYPLKIEKEPIGTAEITKITTTEKSYTFNTIRAKHKEAYRSWTTALDDELTIMFCEGYSEKQMAEHFQRTSGAIRARIKKLELKELYSQEQ